MRELFFRFYRLVSVGNVLKVPPLRDDSSPQHIPNYDHTLGNWFLSLWYLDQLLPFQALSDVLLMDAYFALPELSTITGVFYLLCLGLGPESLGFVEPVQYNDRLYVLWHFRKVYGYSLVHVHVFSGRAKIGLVSQETAELFVDFSEDQLINDLSFFIKEQQACRKVVLWALFEPIGGPSEAYLLLIAQEVSLMPSSCEIHRILALKPMQFLLSRLSTMHLIYIGQSIPDTSCSCSSLFLMYSSSDPSKYFDRYLLKLEI